MGMAGRSVQSMRSEGERIVALQRRVREAMDGGAPLTAQERSLARQLGMGVP